MTCTSKVKKPSLIALQAAYEDGWWCLSVTPRAITFIENNETIFQLMCFDWFEMAQAIF